MKWHCDNSQCQVQSPESRVINQGRKEKNAEEEEMMLSYLPNCFSVKISSDFSTQILVSPGVQLCGFPASADGNICSDHAICWWLLRRALTPGMVRCELTPQKGAVTAKDRKSLISQSKDCRQHHEPDSISFEWFFFRLYGISIEEMTTWNHVYNTVIMLIPFYVRTYVINSF